MRSPKYSDLGFSLSRKSQAADASVSARSLTTLLFEFEEPGILKHLFNFNPPFRVLPKQLLNKLNALLRECLPLGTVENQLVFACRFDCFLVVVAIEGQTLANHRVN